MTPYMLPHMPHMHPRHPAHPPSHAPPHALPGQPRVAAAADRTVDTAHYDTVQRCEVEEDGVFLAATILRSRASPRDVVIWYDGGQQHEGLDGGYTFDGTWLRDPDGDAIEWRQHVTVKVEPGAAVPAAAGLLTLLSAGPWSGAGERGGSCPKREQLCCPPSPHASQSPLPAPCSLTTARPSWLTGRLGRGGSGGVGGIAWCS